jgi:glycosyltransferase involved in cell wall biosynthesis
MIRPWRPKILWAKATEFLESDFNKGKLTSFADDSLNGAYDMPSTKDQKIVVLGGIAPQLRYLSRYAEVLFMPFPDHPVFTNTLNLIAKLTSAILSFKPNMVLVYPSYPYGLPSAVIARLFRKVHVSFAYGNDVARRRTRLGKLSVSLTLRLSHGVICDYEGLAKLVRRMGGRNVATIPMGADIPPLPHLQTKKLPNTIVCVINFNLAYLKGVDLLIRVVKELPNIRLVLIGEGTQRRLMMSFAERLNVSDRVTFTGFIPRKELLIHLLRASLFALPTRPSFHEGTNRAVLEAMLCGLPIVVTKTGGLPELVVDGINGIVVEPENVKDLARAIFTLLSNPELRKEMGRNNKLKAKKYLVDILAAKRYEYLSKFC